jgi:hypothetical protein
MTETIVCPNCGAVNHSDSLYCDQCSLPLKAGGLAGPRPTPVDTVSQPVAPLPPPPTSLPPAPILEGAENPPPVLAGPGFGQGGPPAAHRSSSSLLLLAGVAVVLVFVALGVGVILGGTLNAPVPPTPNVPATVAAMLTGQPATAAPSPTQVAVVVPTVAPTIAPTAVPTAAPTAVPTTAPTEVPVVNPTAIPTTPPTKAPTAAPTPIPPTITPGGPTPTEVLVVTVQINALNGSGESGTAVLTQEYDLGTRIVVTLRGGPVEAQPIHIHVGTCADINPKPQYPLKNVINGRSETLLPISFVELRKGIYVINVHPSETRMEPYAACGAIH